MTQILTPPGQSQEQTNKTQRDASVEAMFPEEAISNLTVDFLERGTDINLKERALAEGKKYVISTIPASSKYADIGRSVETRVFSTRFKRSPYEVVEEYKKYDRVSTFLVVTDVSTEEPMPAGVIRIIEPNTEQGLKSITDLVDDVPKNPWIDEIKRLHFKDDEEYSPDMAWERLGKSAGVILNPNESHDVATISVVPQYRRMGKTLDSVSVALYHTCLRYALGNNIKNLVSIQDLKPFGLLQGFGDPFELFPGLKPHPYGGPYDTIPAFCVLVRGMQNIRDKDESVGRIFIDGQLLGEEFLLLEETLPDQYSNAAVNLPAID